MSQQHRSAIHWHVEVYRDGKRLVAINDKSLTGAGSFSLEDEEAIRLAGEHLLAFIGRRKEQKTS